MKKKRGLAAMTPEQRKRIASLGGKAAQATGKAHRWSSEEAAEAGRKGGLTSKKKRAQNKLDDHSTKTSGG